jgi:hypothetical protein
MARAFGLLVVMTALLAPATAGALTLAVSDDTYTDLRNSTAIFGTRPTILVTAQRRIGFARFDLAPLPADLDLLDVRKATLRLYVESVVQPGRISVHAALGDWNESTLNAATAPPFGTRIDETTIGAATRDKFVHLDVTDLVRAWVTDRRATFGLLLHSESGSFTINAKESRRMSHPMVIEVVIN